MAVEQGGKDAASSAAMSMAFSLGESVDDVFGAPEPAQTSDDLGASGDVNRAKVCKENAKAKGKSAGGPKRKALWRACWP